MRSVRIRAKYGSIRGGDHLVCAQSTPNLRRGSSRKDESSWSLYSSPLPMRTSWNGSLSFGLVSIPVGLAPATKPAARQSDVSFRLLHRECATPIKQKRWCPTHDREVSQDEMVRGFEG